MNIISSEKNKPKKNQERFRIFLISFCSTNSDKKDMRVKEEFLRVLSLGV